jgi:hypothetical protein
MYRSILEQELENWEGFASKLRDIRDRDLFIQMLKSAYKYSGSIDRNKRGVICYTIVVNVFNA